MVKAGSKSTKDEKIYSLVVKAAVVGKNVVFELTLAAQICLVYQNVVLIYYQEGNFIKVV